MAGTPGGPAELTSLPGPQSVVEGLLSPEEDHSLLMSRFQEYLEHDDIRYHTMQAATGVVGQVADRYPEVSRVPCLGEGCAGAAPELMPGFRQVPPAFWNNAFALLSAVSLPCQEVSSSSFYVKHAGERPGGRGGGTSEPPPLSRTPSDPCLPYRAVTQVEGRSSEGETLRGARWGQGPLHA